MRNVQIQEPVAANSTVGLNRNHDSAFCLLWDLDRSHFNIAEIPVTRVTHELMGPTIAPSKAANAPAMMKRSCLLIIPTQGLATKINPIVQITARRLQYLLPN